MGPCDSLDYFCLEEFRICLSTFSFPQPHALRLAQDAMSAQPNADEESQAQPLLDPSLHRSLSNVTSQVAIVGSNVCPIESLDYEYVFHFLPFWCFSCFICVIRVIGFGGFFLFFSGFTRMISSNRIGGVAARFRSFSTYS